MAKFKPFADKKLHVDKIMKLVLNSVKAIVGKVENAGYQPFPLFLQSFQKLSVSKSVKLLKLGILCEEFTKGQHFRLAQIENMCRQHFKVDTITENCHSKERRKRGKGENACNRSCFF